MPTQTDTMNGAGSELLENTKTLGSSAVDRLHSEVDSRKGDGLTQVHAVSSALERTAGDLDENAPAWLKSTFEQGAQQIQKFAEALEQKDSRQLVNDVSDFARQSPVTFLAACAAAGFGAARIFKAGASDAASTSYSPDTSFGQTGTAQSTDLSAGGFQGEAL